MPQFTLVKLPTSWVSAAAFDQALANAGDPLCADVEEVVFQFPPDTKPMMDVVLPLLSLANQLAASGKRVTLQFDGGWKGVMSYLDRVGFFQLLDGEVQVRPPAPTRSGAKVHAGQNPGVVELRCIRAESREASTPGILVNALEAATANRPDSRALANAAFTLFAELIDNIYEHSGTHLDGYAGMQVYTQGNVLRVAVSDSGLGILETLRKGCLDRRDAALRDRELLVELFQRGISRHGPMRGCGLRRCAEHAQQFRAVLHLRLPRCCLRLEPGLNGLRPAAAHCRDGLPLIWGTHLHFEFQLDDAKTPLL